MNDHDLHPAAYLASLSIDSEDQMLTQAEVSSLVNLFRTCAVACDEKYGQDCTLSTASPVYRLLRTNVPEVVEVEGEGGNLVFLNDIKRVLDGPSAVVIP